MHIDSTAKIHAAIRVNLPIVFTTLITNPPAYIGELETLDTIVFENLTINKDMLIMEKKNENKIYWQETLQTMNRFICTIYSFGIG